MNRRRRATCTIAAVAGILFLWGCAAGTTRIADDRANDQPSDEQETTGYIETAGDEHSGRSFLENIFFRRGAGTEEVVLAFSAIPDDINLTQPANNVVALALRNTVPSENARERYVPEALSQVRSVSLRHAVKADNPALNVAIELAEIVPYRMHHAGSSVIVAFDTAAVLLNKPSGGESREPVPAALQDPIRTHLEEEALLIEKDEPAEFRGERLSIVCQDTHIKNVFRLISEVSGYNIVAGPDVDQKLSLHMRNVPWDQALDTILEVNGLGMTTRGKVITVMPLEKMEEAEEKRLEKNVAAGRVRQLSIEAKIVEVNTSFSREIGVKWGIGFSGTWGSRDTGIIFGSSAPGNDTSVTTLPAGIGLTSSNLAVNFPSATASTTPALGIVAGSSKFILDAKLQALEEVGDGRIISSPKVTTADKVKAMISQGEVFDVQIVGADGETTTKTIDATLSLEVTPQITAEGKVSLEIDARNRYADWSRSGDGGIVGPPINTSAVQSQVVINDGDTIVIGGIYKSEDTEGGSGIPWISSVPVLGWLFKDRSIVKKQMELLIFITPVILGETTVRG